ncbi:hypothetical protein J3F83DRAFT_42465 [Trichoderma novae-zelandiae]
MSTGRGMAWIVHRETITHGQYMSPLFLWLFLWKRRSTLVAALEQSLYTADPLMLGSPAGITHHKSFHGQLCVYELAELRSVDMTPRSHIVLARTNPQTRLQPGTNFAKISSYSSCCQEGKHGGLWEVPEQGSQLHRCSVIELDAVSVSTGDPTTMAIRAGITNVRPDLSLPERSGQVVELPKHPLLALSAPFLKGNLEKEEQRRRAGSHRPSNATTHCRRAPPIGSAKFVAIC